MSDVEWRPIPSHADTHEVSSDGRVRTKRGELVQRLNNCGYPVVRLWKAGGEREHTVHSLVASAFVGARPEGMEVRHKDGVRANNHASNLCYGTKQENEADKVLHGTSNRGERCATARLTASIIKELRERKRFYGCVARWAKELGVNAATISLALSGKTWSHV
jgi:hypothetical protein